MSVGRITTGRVLWPAGANWTTGKREVIVELKPIGPDGNCTGCGAKPTRDTGSCRCLPQITTALAATPRPDPADAPAPDAGLDVERERYTPSTIPSQRELLEKQRPSYHFPGVGDAAAPAPDAGLREALEGIVTIKHPGIRIVDGKPCVCVWHEKARAALSRQAEAKA
jgi:hypothetical protein